MGERLATSSQAGWLAGRASAFMPHRVAMAGPLM